MVIKPRIACYLNANHGISCNSGCQITVCMNDQRVTVIKGHCGPEPWDCTKVRNLRRRIPGDSDGPGPSALSYLDIARGQAQLVRYKATLTTGI